MKKILLIVTILLICASSVIGCKSTSTTTPVTTTAVTTAPATTTAPTTAPATTTAATTKPATSTAPATTTPAASQGPKSGGTLTFIFWISPKTPGGLPWELFGGEFLPIQSVFDSFFNMNNKGDLQPCLATAYQVADDHMSITFNLRNDVKFSDGTAFDANAAKWNLDQTIAAKSAPYWKSVDVIDNYTVRVNLISWTNTILSGFTSIGTWMISPTVYQQKGADYARQHPTGTGPFTFDSFQQDVNYKVVKNPNYWQKGKPHLDAINVLFISDLNTMRMAMESGTADVCQDEPNQTAVSLKNGGFSMETYLNTVFCFLPDTAHPDSPYANKLVREAVEYAINKEAIAKAFSFGFWSAPYQIASTSSTAYNPNSTLARKYDPVKAKALLAEAGYPDGFNTKLGWPPLGYDKNIVLAIQADLAKVGIKGELDAPPVLPQYFDASNNAHDELFFQPIFSGANWNGALGMSFSSDVKYMNLAWGKTPEWNALYTKTMGSVAPDQQLMWDAFGYLSSECLAIPVMAGGLVYVHAAYVMDAGWYQRGGNYEPENVWLNK